MVWKVIKAYAHFEKITVTHIGGLGLFWKASKEVTRGFQLRDDISKMMLP